MYDTIFFDLDGTLTDPGLGITNSVMHALRHYGIEENERSRLYCFIGPPLKDSFMKYYGFPEVKAQEAIGVYREYFAVKGLYENEVYPGIPEMLRALRDSGYRLAVATSKPETFSEQILEHFGLLPYFSLVAGASMDEVRVRKEDVIAYAMEQLGLRDPKKVLMVGDREHDIIGAKANGMDAAGVLFGYGSREELQEAGADYLAETPEELLQLILNGGNQ